MVFKAQRFLVFVCILLVTLSCEKEKVFKSNTIQRTSNFFQDGNHESIYNIISKYLKENPQIVYARIKYPGNSIGHLFSANTPESREIKRKILFKVVDNQKSEYSIDRGIELTAFRGDTEYTTKRIFFDNTNSRIKIMNEDFQIILNK